MNNANANPAVHCAHAKLVDVAELIPNPRNPNKHGDKQVAMLAKIIRHQGWRAPITVSKRSGFIVTGHGRLEAAKLLQVQTVPVDFQDFATEADEWAHLVADNRIAELAEIDNGGLESLLQDLDGAIDLDLTGFDAEAMQDVDGAGNLSEDSDPAQGADKARGTLAERFGVPPFSVLDARQGYWQDRKRGWLALGIKSELGRGGGAMTETTASFKNQDKLAAIQRRPAAARARRVTIPSASEATEAARQ